MRDAAGTGGTAERSAAEWVTTRPRTERGAPVTNEPSAPQTDGQQPTVERGGLWGLFFSTAGLLLPPFGLLLSAFGIIQGRKARRAAKASNGQARAP